MASPGWPVPPTVCTRVTVLQDRKSCSTFSWVKHSAICLLPEIFTQTPADMSVGTTGLDEVQYLCHGPLLFSLLLLGSHLACAAPLCQISQVVPPLMTIYVMMSLTYFTFISISAGRFSPVDLLFILAVILLCLHSSALILTYVVSYISFHTSICKITRQLGKQVNACGSVKCCLLLCCAKC